MAQPNDIGNRKRVAVKVISDIHGAYDALAGQLEQDDTAVLLGDYLDLVDFRTLGGILSQVYTREEIWAALSALSGGSKELARKSIQEISMGSEDKRERVRELMADGYRRFYSSLPCRAFVIYGNTDSPQMLREYASGDVEILESGVVEIDGSRFGFVSGAPFGPWTVGLPGEMEPARYDALVGSLGPVDVLCTHCPPAIPELTWDVKANRDEKGSGSLLEYIDLCEPSFHYFGHVHNPRMSEVVRGRTRVMNAGFFKESGTALVFEH